MTIRSRIPARLVAAVLASVPALALAQSQDPPLYRDPSPTEGLRIGGPLLPPRAPTPAATPPPPSGLGPFQAPTPGPDPSGLAPPAVVAPEPPREPLLGVAPMPPPSPAPVYLPAGAGGAVEVRRKTTIQGPKGVLGRIHEWFRDACFGPPRPPAAATAAPAAPRHGLFATLHQGPPEGDAPPRFFNWPAWPAWPTSTGH